MIINCSNCNVPLLEFHEVDRKLDIEWNLVAECSHCGDSSFHWDAVGTYYADDTEYTGVINIETNNNNEITFKTKSLKKWK